VLASEDHETGSSQTFTEIWTPGHGFTTGPTQLHLTGTMSSVYLQAIACPSSSWCAAVGSGKSNGRQTGAGAILNSGVWGPVTALNNPIRSLDYGLSDISCASPGNCAAVGDSFFSINSSSPSTWVVDLTAGAWGAAQTVLTPIGIAGLYPQEDELSLTGTPTVQVSCAGIPMTCTLVDTYLSPPVGPFGVVAQSSNGEWGQYTMLPQHVAPGRQWELTSVSCVTGPSCVAGGASVDFFSRKAVRELDRSFQWVPTGSPSGEVTTASATLVHGSDARVRWALPIGGAPVDHYNVWASTGPVQRTNPLETKSMSVLLRGLTLRHTTYTIEVQAIGRDGQAMAPVVASLVTTA